MRISNFVQKGVAFESALVKLLLNHDILGKYIKDFSEKSGENWEDKGECQRCADGQTCKKHKALDMVQSVEDCVKVLNYHNVEGFNLFIAKFALFVPNPDAKTLLLMDCPPLTTPQTGSISDTWVRRVTPFTFGNIESPTPNVVQEINFKELYKFPVLTMRMGRERDHLLELHNISGITHHWAVTKLDQN
ncbi:MAG: hypothetical protein KAS32_18020 [Candidatus Peribacteraceae bacterium]|nr:hypothetical protein [Candidatus Peribacteraceae bacterium]